MPRNRGKNTRERRDLTTNPLTLEERNALLDALLKPPEAISKAIIGSMAVEHELEESIRRRFGKISDDDWRIVLSDESGPLGTFDRKIKLAKHLGIFDAVMKSNFDIIRDVRNLFAHSKRLIDFNHPLVAAQLKKIRAPKNAKRSFARIQKFDDGSHQFVLLCILCTGAVSKKRYATMSAAHKAWMKRRKLSPLGGLFSDLFGSPSPSKTPTPTSPLRPGQTISGPKALTRAGLVAGLLSPPPPSDPSNLMGGLFHLGLGLLNEKKKEKD
jgi:hypothetical protein